MIDPKKFDPQRLLKGIVAGKIPKSPHATVMRIPRIDGWEPGRVWSTWEIDPDLISPQGTLFGGYISTVADEMTGMATLSVLEKGESFVTADLRVNFFRPVFAGTLNAEATITAITAARVSSAPTTGPIDENPSSLPGPTAPVVGPNPASFRGSSDRRKRPRGAPNAGTIPVRMSLRQGTFAM